MFLFWGTKEVKKKLGYVADYCLTCGDIRTFRICKHSNRSHIYYLPYGKDKNTEYRITCETCNSCVLTDVDRYQLFIKGINESTPLDQVVHETFPNIRVLYKERLSLDRDMKLHPDNVDKAIKMSLIREPFEIYERELAEFRTQTQIDKETLFSLAISLIMPVAVFMLFDFLSIRPDLMAIALLLTIAVNIIILLIQFKKVLPRYVVRGLYPKLACSLGKYIKCEPEIQETFDTLKSEGYVLANKGSYAQLYSQLNGN